MPSESALYSLSGPPNAQAPALVAASPTAASGAARADSPPTTMLGIKAGVDLLKPASTLLPRVASNSVLSCMPLPRGEIWARIKLPPDITGTCCGSLDPITLSAGVSSCPCFT